MGMASSKYRPKIIEIYSASEEEAKKIKEAADKAGLTTSKFVLNVVRPHIYQSEEGPTRSGLIEESTELRDEVRHLREDGKVKDLLLERYEAELRRIRDTAFLAPSGEAALNPDLLKILRKGPIHERRLLDALGISEDDALAVRALSRQLSILEATRFAAKGPNGWRWLG
jgi:hypothetical protein